MLKTVFFLLTVLVLRARLCGSFLLIGVIVMAVYYITTTTTTTIITIIF